MIKLKRILLLPVILMLSMLNSCQYDDILSDKYDRPEWLAGKVYTQIKEQPNLSVFARCIELTGYDTIIDVSGSYTVIAPSNEAFEVWLNDNNYNDVEDIPLQRLNRLVSYHIIQNPWTKNQLRSLDVFGWIDTLDRFNNQPAGFKRQTFLREENRKYGIASKGPGTAGQENFMIVDTTSTNFHRKAFTTSRKYIPVFYQEYFDIYDLDGGDYEFYFDRPFSGGDNIHFAGARVDGDEIFAENGFVYVVDRVVDPLPNAYQILSDNNSSNSYSAFFELLNQFPVFSYNQQETLRQPGAQQGLQVDSLFNLSFPELVFNIASERTQPPKGTFGLPENVTIRYHHGTLAPENTVFEDFVNEYIKIPGGWGSLEQTPDHIKNIIVNSHLSFNAIYPTDLSKGFFNGEGDLVTIDQSNIIQKQFGSNSTFIGLNEAIVPRAFKSVTGPVYLQRGYEKVMIAIEQAGLLPALKRRNENYMFFIESDINTSIDSSLVYNRFRDEFSVFEILDLEDYTEYKLGKSDLRTLLLNHIAIGQPEGLARKEFIPNLAGNFIVVNNETGEYSGTGPTTFGFRGQQQMPNFPRVTSTNTDNGTTYDIDNWFTFSSTPLFARISSSYPKFHALLRKAGLSLDQQFRYSFISDSDSYTVFIPSDEAIDAVAPYLNGLSVDELRSVLLLHFVRGNMIFTDGKKESDYYETVRVDESSTPFTTLYTQIYIQPGIDVIRIRDNNGGNNVEINESNITNILTGVNTSTDSDVFPVINTNAVIHEIDKVLFKEELDTK